MEKEPKIAICTPVHNDLERLLKNKELITKHQEYSNWHWYVVNDCSRGEDFWPIATLATDDRITHCYQTSRRGVSNARNIALERIREDGTFKYVAFLDSDDFWYDYHLKTSIEQLRQGFDFCYSKAVHYFEDGTKAIPYGIPDPFVFDSKILQKKNFIYVSSVVLDVDCLRVGNFVSEFDSVEDWHYWLRVWKAGCRITSLMDKPHVYYTVKMNGGASKCTTDLEDKMKTDFEYLCKREMEGKMRKTLDDVPTLR